MTVPGPSGARTRKVLFVCTGNSCRSQMAEALLRQVGGDRFEALSAGTRPAGFVHPLAVEAMARLKVPMDGAVSKSWDECLDSPVDLVITVCDQAAAEPCPGWPGSPLVVHWGLPDPAYHPGTAAERLEFALRVAQRLRTKIEGLVALDWDSDRGELARRLTFLGEI